MPPPTPVDASRERGHDRVQVGRDVEAEELLVVGGVADDGDPTRVRATREAREEPGSAHATREDDD